MTLVAGTSQYHSLKRLRSQETKGINDDKSERMIHELDDMRGNIVRILKSINGDLTVEIRAEIPDLCHRHHIPVQHHTRDAAIFCFYRVNFI